MQTRPTRQGNHRTYLISMAIASTFRFCLVSPTEPCQAWISSAIRGLCVGLVVYTWPLLHLLDSHLSAGYIWHCSLPLARPSFHQSPHSRQVAAPTSQRLRLMVHTPRAPCWPLAELCSRHMLVVGRPLNPHALVGRFSSGPSHYISRNSPISPTLSGKGPSPWLIVSSCFNS